jgi:hypothetical protein
MSPSRRLALLAAVCVLLSLGAGSAPRQEPGAEKPIKPFAVKDRAILKGRVIIGAKRPDLDKLNRELLKSIENSPDKARVLELGKAATEQQIWQIDEKGGVANVLVWLRPPEGHYFQLEHRDFDARQAGWSPRVTVRAPHYHLTPRIAVLFPTSHEGKKTGQVAEFAQDGPGIHHIQAIGVKPQNDWGYAHPLKAILPLTLRADDAFPYLLRCNIHPWVRGNVLALDHHWGAVTDKEGRYEIKNAPAGIEVRLFAWHEGKGWVNQNRKDGETVQLVADKVTERDFTITLKEK